VLSLDPLQTTTNERLLALSVNLGDDILAAARGEKDE